MKETDNNSTGASALQITVSIALLSVAAILLAIAVPIDSERPYEQNPLGGPTLGNYPNTTMSLSTDVTITPDAPPTNTTSINVSTSVNFNGTLEGYPATGV
jgi:hypothetical protein